MERRVVDRSKLAMVLGEVGNPVTEEVSDTA